MSDQFSTLQFARFLPDGLKAVAETDEHRTLSLASTLGVQRSSTNPEETALALMEGTLRQLNSSSRADREEARQIITDIILNPANIDESGRMISTLISSWRHDLVAAATTIERVEEISANGPAIQLWVQNTPPKEIIPLIREILRAEHEHTDWLVSLVVARASLFRADLEEIVVGLRDFCRGRSHTSFVLTGDLFPHASELRTKHLHLPREDDFLREVMAAMEKNFRMLSDERLPEGVRDIVEQQILYPVDTQAYYEQLADLILDREEVSGIAPPTEIPSHETLVEAIKERARHVMRTVELESLVFFDRATHSPERCVPLDKISPYTGSIEVQCAQIEARFREEAQIVVLPDDALERLVTQLRSELLQLQEDKNWKVLRPHLFTLYYEGQRRSFEQPAGFIIQIAPGKAPVENSQEVSSYPDRANAKSQTEGELNDAPTARPLEMYMTIIRPNSRDLLTDMEALAKWLSQLESQLNPLSADDDARNTRFNNPANPVPFDVSPDEDNEIHNYFGLSYEQCNESFRPFFALLKERYQAAWELLPKLAQESPQLINVADFTPIQQSMDILSIMDDHETTIRKLPEGGRQRVRQWLELYSSSNEAGTAELLLTAPLWKGASVVAAISEARSWHIEDREELLEQYNQLISPALYAPEAHLILAALNDHGAKTLTKLLEDGLVYLDGFSSAAAGCCNKMPIEELEQRILHRARNIVNAKGRGSLWHLLDPELARQSSVALQFQAAPIWIDIYRSYQRGIL